MLGFCFICQLRPPLRGVRVGAGLGAGGPRIQWGGREKGLGLPEHLRSLCCCLAGQRPGAPGAGLGPEPGEAFRGPLLLSASPTLPQNRCSPGAWGYILQGLLQAWNFFEVSHFILKTHASCALGFIMFEYLLSGWKAGFTDRFPGVGGRTPSTPTLRLAGRVQGPGASA